MNSESEKRVIVLPENPIQEKKDKEGIKKQRVIIEKEHWNFDETVYTEEYQYKSLLYQGDIDCYNKMLQQIKRKIQSYKQQDKTKNLFNSDKIINDVQVLELLRNCEFLCYYCRKMIHVLYKNVREPKQWTLERIDNDYGHNHDNVVISCLECNLHRRTMYHERYVFTKQLVVKKI